MRFLTFKWQCKNSNVGRNSRFNLKHSLQLPLSRNITARYYTTKAKAHVNRPFLLRSMKILPQLDYTCLYQLFHTIIFTWFEQVLWNHNSQQQIKQKVLQFCDFLISVIVSDHLKLFWYIKYASTNASSSWF